MSTLPRKEVAKTPAQTVIGWLLVSLSFLVMAFGYNNGEFNQVVWAGVALIPLGIVFVVLGKQKISKACATNE